MSERIPQHQPTPDEIAEANRLMTLTQEEMSKQQEFRMERSGVVFSEDVRFGMGLSRDLSEADKAFAAEVRKKWPDAYAGSKISGKTVDGRSIKITGVLTDDGSYFSVFINGISGGSWLQKPKPSSASTVWSPLATIPGRTTIDSPQTETSTVSSSSGASSF